MLDRDVVLAFLRDHKSYFNEHFGVTEIALFGSYARNEARSDSDIDILIEMPKKSFFKRIALREFLEQHFDRKVDVGYFDSMRTFIMHYAKKDLIYA